MLDRQQTDPKKDCSYQTRIPEVFFALDLPPGDRFENRKNDWNKASWTLRGLNGRLPSEKRMR
jgi:hypothetical protein